ncbi:ABC transporter ATP-binding protein [Uliginosibacterium sp. H1]|uniref:ABC transporter ATP-binding protein n=1 Tax=Uliginosibacterium sp. H1 TaxID=3114757 RepID=UPI002E194A26|nr:ABC transporter ATP-binding protein [Uliginosibacterium sp. H1]
MAAQINIRVQDKRFGDKQVLSQIALDIAPGEVVSLLGPSGCGKSTLLRIAAGLDTDYRGSLLLDTRPVAEAPLGAVGVVFQEPRLLPWLSVADNVAFASGKAAANVARVAALLDEVGLRDAGPLLPKQLSGGMAQRVAIARALYTQPRVMLLDEPFSAVDAFTRMRLQDLLLNVAAHHGTTLVVVTHDIDEALYLSDRIVVMGAAPGRILADLRIAQARPRDRRDAQLALLRAEILDTLDAAHAL